MRTRISNVRVRTAVSVAIVAVGVPALLLGSANRGEAGAGVAAVNTAGSVLSPGAQVGSAGSNGSAVTSTTTTTSGSGGTTTSGNLPADKVTTSGSKIDVFSPNTDVTLLAVQMRTSNPADLMLSVTLECSIVTSVTTMGNDMQQAFGQVRVWLEIDGKPVGVIPATQGTSDDGKVVFCNRTYSSTTNGFSEAGNSGNQDPTITTYINTKEANAFNWVAMNVGNGIHTVSVHAELTQQVTDPSKDSAQAVVGNRTLLVDTTETAQNQAS
jgi:hypothetical protein